MANLVTTMHCNHQCAFCFAREVPGLLNMDDLVMSRSLYLQGLEYLRRSGIEQVRLLGGEPSLHPDFTWHLETALEHGFQVMVFSNGLFRDAQLAFLGTLAPEHLSVLLNSNAILDRGVDPGTERVLQHLGSKVILGFTISHPRMTPEHLLEWIDRFEMRRSVRLGLAHPGAGNAEDYLPPGWYEQVGRMVAAFTEKAAATGVHVDLDCGFVPCMFPETFFALPGIDSAAIGCRCGPIPDILPDGSVIPCFPLAGLARTWLHEQFDASASRQQLEEQLPLFRKAGIYGKCAGCRWRHENKCTGGCLAAAMIQLRHFPFRIETGTAGLEDQDLAGDSARVALCSAINKPAGDDLSVEVADERKWIIPYVDQPLEFWEEIESTYGRYIAEVYLPLPGGPGSGRPPQPSRYLRDFMRSAGLPFSVLVNPMVLKQGLQAAVAATAKAIDRVLEDHELAGITVANPKMAARLKENFPGIPLTASTLMDVSTPCQAAEIRNIFDVLVPSSRIMRDLPRLLEVRESFGKTMRLLVNEACLPGCLNRVQHFYEMALADGNAPSLCEEVLHQWPWMRLTGAWVLPQHLSLYQGVYDQLKLAGRVALNQPETYRQVLGAYVNGLASTPDRIAGGPASILEPLEIEEAFFKYTLMCGKQCHRCHICRDYYANATRRDTMTV